MIGMLHSPCHDWHLFLMTAQRANKVAIKISGSHTFDIFLLFVYNLLSVYKAVMYNMKTYELGLRNIWALRSD